MAFDIFASLTIPGWDGTVHNVYLVDVRPAPDGQHEVLTVQRDGAGVRELIGGGRWNEEFSRRQVGRVGYLVPARSVAGLERPAGACYFRDYVDQTLRRVPELDSDGRAVGPDGTAAAVIGWECEARGGFRAPAGLIPGERGDFEPDQTIAVTIRVPPEFVREAKRYQLTPAQLLRGFVGDVAGIHNFINRPRADGYGSNGSDERDMAEAWIERAYGMQSIDLEALEAADDESEQRQFERDDFADLLEAFTDAGGESRELFAAVEALVAAREAAAKATDASDDE